MFHVIYLPGFDNRSLQEALNGRGSGKVFARFIADLGFRDRQQSRFDYRLDLRLWRIDPFYITI